MRISKVEAQALAAFVSRIRPDWQQPGIVAAIEKAAPLGAPAAIGAALCRLAENLELRTPALLAEAGPHWSGTSVAKLPPPVMCPQHPGQKASWCLACEDESVPPPPAFLAAKAAIPRRQTVHTHPAPPVTDVARAKALRKQVDAEEAQQ